METTSFRCDETVIIEQLKKCKALAEKLEPANGYYIGLDKTEQNLLNSFHQILNCNLPFESLKELAQQAGLTSSNLRTLACNLVLR